jgi:hypothetical protein
VTTPDPTRSGATSASAEEPAAPGVPAPVTPGSGTSEIDTALGYLLGQ